MNQISEKYKDWSLAGIEAEHWLHKPNVLGLIPVDCQPFRFPVVSYHLT